MTKEQNIAREYLQQFRKLDFAIKLKLDELEEQEELILNFKTRNDNVKVKGGKGHSAVEDSMIKFIESKAKIENQVKTLCEKRDKVREVIDKVDNATLRNILEGKYINGMTIDAIAFELGYVGRHTIRFHVKALDEVAKILHIEA